MLDSHFYFKISDQPKFIETPQELIVVNNNKTKILTLNCMVDSNPAANVIWLRNDIELIEIGNRLKLEDFSVGSQYTCKATNQYFEAVNFTTTVLVEGNLLLKKILIKNKNFLLKKKTGPPTIIGEKFYTIVKNDYLNVDFKVLSNPQIDVMIY